MTDNRSKALKLKWSKGITLKQAWDVVKKKKKGDKKKGEPSRKSSSKVKGKKPSAKSSTKAVKTPRSSVTKVINGKERKIYTGSSGGKYYKSKGKRVYLPKKSS